MTVDAIRDGALAPVAPKDRIFTLDMLRGWAILGILAVNAMVFAWPFGMEMTPGLTPPYPHDLDNIRGQWATSVFFEHKFRSLFSMLFGVSVFLVGGERSDEARGALLRRRLMWLGVFGLIHGVAIWYGDILLHYAYCGFIMMLVRSWPAKRLILVGGGVNLAIALLSAGLFLLMAAMAGQAGAAGMGAQGNPMAMTQETLLATIAAYQSGWPQTMIQNVQAWLTLQMASLFLIPITVGLMMLGLGLFKSGFLTGRSKTWVYGLVAAVGLANLAVLAWLGWQDASAPRGAMTAADALAKVAGSFAWVITLGYVSVLILMTRFGLKVLTGALAPVGRMAFTNYVTQSLLMGSLFYLPWGPNLFGDPAWGPGRLWLAVGAIWVLQLIWSPLWLSRFQMGPLEWLWRCLTYRRRVPLSKSAGA